MTKTKIRIGTRRSPLALWQAEHVSAKLREAWPELEVVLVKITTTGDRIRGKPLVDIGGKDLFTREIEDALLRDRVDLAVHSLKDLPTALPEGLTVGAVLERAAAGDVWIANNNVPLAEVPEGATVATGSLRRRAQLLHHRPDLNTVDLRGNVDTRIAKLRDNPDWAGIILAEAGVVRLERETEITETIPPEVILSAVGQGAVAVEVRETDPATAKLVAPLNHADTRACVTAERALLNELEAGCQVPIGARGTIRNNTLTLDALISDLDGRRRVRDQRSGKPEEAEALGRQLAQALREQGGAEIVESLKQLGETKENR